MEIFIQRVAEIAAGVLGVDADAVAPHLRVPDPEHGDVALPCFPWAKQLREPPPEIAARVAEALDAAAGLQARAAGPYVNVRFDAAAVVAAVLPEIRSRGLEYGHSDEGGGAHVVIDFSSPNIAKPIAFHHIRSTAVGAALGNLHRALGYTPVGINYLGDWGKQFGLLALGFQRFGDEARLAAEGIRYLVELYARANLAAKGDEAQGAAPEAGFDDAARELFQKMEQGDEDVLALWKRFREVSLLEFQRIYDRLGVRFEHIEGESRYAGVLDATVDRVADTCGVKTSEGALVAAMEYSDDEPPFMLRKGDGATLYGTRDLAAAIDRRERFAFAKSLYVVGNQQALYFGQLFRCLAAMGFDWAERCMHVGFGTVLKKKPDASRKDGFALERFATRRGEVIYLEEVLGEAVSKAREIMRETNPDLGNPDEVAEQVGVGAVLFMEHSHRRAKDVAIEVDENDDILWEKLIDFKGQTGPYLQYAHARSCSILRKGGGAPGVGEVDLTPLTHEAEIALVKELGGYPADIRRAVDELEPALLSERLIAIGRSVSHYYTLGNQDRSLRVLCDDEATRAARLCLVDAVRIVLAGGLALLGIPAPERM